MNIDALIHPTKTREIGLTDQKTYCRLIGTEDGTNKGQANVILIVALYDHISSLVFDNLMSLCGARLKGNDQIVDAFIQSADIHLPSLQSLLY